MGDGQGCRGREAVIAICSLVPVQTRRPLILLSPSAHSTACQLNWNRIMHPLLIHCLVPAHSTGFPCTNQAINRPASQASMEACIWTRPAMEFSAVTPFVFSRPPSLLGVFLFYFIYLGLLLLVVGLWRRQVRSHMFTAADALRQLDTLADSYQCIYRPPPSSHP